MCVRMRAVLCVHRPRACRGRLLLTVWSHPLPRVRRGLKAMRSHRGSGTAGSGERTRTRTAVSAVAVCLRPQTPGLTPPVKGQHPRGLHLLLYVLCVSVSHLLKMNPSL